jgi:hypothetical protein
VDRQAAAGVDEPARQEIDGPGLPEGARHDEHEGDDDHGRVAETGKRLLCRHGAQDDGEGQGAEGDQVVAEAAPEEEGEDAAHQEEQDDLVLLHGSPGCVSITGTIVLSAITMQGGWWGVE